jgi:hypothetical protein
MQSVPRDLTDIVSDILVLASARPSIPIPRPLVHVILWKMQGEESLLSRVRFTITGDVCFSREIDAAINKLIVRGTIRTANDGKILLNDIPTLRSLSHARNSGSKYYELLTASRTFYQRLKEWMTPVPKEMAISSAD